MIEEWQCLQLKAPHETEYLATWLENLARKTLVEVMLKNSGSSDCDHKKQVQATVLTQLTQLTLDSKIAHQITRKQSHRKFMTHDQTKKRSKPCHFSVHEMI